MVELLYQHGVDVNAQNLVKNTPLHYAALGGKKCKTAFNLKSLKQVFFLIYFLAHHKTVKFLLKHGANRNIRNLSDQTPLDMAKAGSTEGTFRGRVIDYLQMCYVIRN